MERRLLIFHPALAPYRIDFFNALAKRFSVHLVLLGKNLQEQQFNQSDLCARLHCRYSYLLSGLIFRKRYIRTGFLRIVRKENPDIVMGYEFSLITVSLLLYKLIFRQTYKFYTMTDDNAEMIAKTHGWRRWIKCFVLRHADGCLVLNEQVVPLFRQLVGGERCCRFVSIPLIYDQENLRRNEDVVFQRAKDWRVCHLQTDEKMLAFVGRLTAVKNVSWLLSRVSDERWPRHVKLFVVGSGEEESSLRELIAEKGLSPQVEFLGRKEGEDLQTLFAAMDCLVLPSAFEPFGAVVSEALHWGASVLVSNHVGAQGLVRLENGCVFSLEEPENFIPSLEEVLRRQGNWRPGRAGKIAESLANAVTAFNPFAEDLP